DLLVAVERKRPVGYVAAGSSPDEDIGDSVGEVAALYVDPDQWRCGIGRTLLSEALERLRSRAFTEATLWCLADNGPAIRLYQDSGFDKDGGQRRDPDFGEALERRFRVALHG